MAGVEINGISYSGSGISQETATPDYQDDVSLPGYFIFLSFGFKLIATLIAVLMAGWVFATIKTRKVCINLIMSLLLL